MPYRLILASTSPRRRELVGLLGLEFEAVDVLADETPSPLLTPAENAMAAARAKAACVDPKRNEVVIGVDTVVVCGGLVYGKPKDRQDARRMIRSYSNGSHEVISGVCLKSRDWEEVFCEVTKVFFAPLDGYEIEGYLSGEEPWDKAGAYGIQGQAARYIARIEGDYYNVMGMPVPAIYARLKNRK